MGNLRDEVYENLDYLSQLTEVVIAPQNEILGRIPDRIQLTFAQINKIKLWTWSSKGEYAINIREVLHECMPEENTQYLTDIEDHFRFEVSDDFELDIAHEKMTGTISLVKVSQQIDDKKMLQLAVEKANLELMSYNWPRKRLREKITTILNVFEPGYGTEWAKNLDGKIAFNGSGEIRQMLSSTILENKWRIRDATVILKIGQWINSYLTDGGDTNAGLVNLMKLKIMLNKDLPIYSIDEVKNANPV